MVGLSSQRRAPSPCLSKSPTRSAPASQARIASALVRGEEGLEVGFTECLTSDNAVIMRHFHGASSIRRAEVMCRHVRTNRTFAPRRHNTHNALD